MDPSLIRDRDGDVAYIIADAAYLGVEGLCAWAF